MQIKYIDISNFRNLDGLKLSFDDNCNFIVGENNLGKSNILSMLSTIFCDRAFKESDFYITTEKINIELWIKLNDVEIGVFDDLFEAEDNHIIKINCYQNSVDDRIEFEEINSKINISPTKIRNLNFVYYNSLKDPEKEINFSKSRGIGGFLNKLVNKYLSLNGIEDNEFINMDKIDPVLEYVNSLLVKVKALRTYNISALCEDELPNLLNRMLVFKDNNCKSLFQTGHGVQFELMIILALLEKIDNVVSFNNNQKVFEDAVGHKYVSLVIGLDEPEIHLHPFMQRALIKYLKEIISNSNSEFSRLIKEIFDIDIILGQIIIITHSSSIISSDYNQITRLYKSGSDLKSVSGAAISLNENIEKHLHILFPFIKEAMFARSVIFVEGESEEGSFPGFAESMGIDIDDFGICIINTHGEKGLKPAFKLAVTFGIPAVFVADNDNGKVSESEFMFVTKSKDFEQEIIDFAFECDKADVIGELYLSTGSDQNTRMLQPTLLDKKIRRHYKLVTEEITYSLVYNNCATDKERLFFLLTWFSNNKSIMLGKIIGDNLPENLIPEVYKKIILKAVELSRNV